jgi:hypothetical protein
MEDNNDEGLAARFISLIDQNKNINHSKILKKLFQKLNELYTEHLNKVSIFKDDKMLYKVRNVYVNFMNFKILKQIKLEIKNKIAQFQEDLQQIFTNLNELKNKIFEKVNDLLSFVEKLPSIIYKLQTYVNNENNIFFEKENFILDYSYAKLKAHIGNYIRTIKFNKEIDTNIIVATNYLEMIRYFFKYFYPDRFNSKIIANTGLRNMILTKINSNKDGQRYHINDTLLVISPQNQINLEEIILTQMNNYKTATGFYQVIANKFGKCKFSLYDNNMYLTGRFIHFAERRGNFFQ